MSLYRAVYGEWWGCPSNPVWSGLWNKEEKKKIGNPELSFWESDFEGMEGEREGSGGDREPEMIPSCRMEPWTDLNIDEKRVALRCAV